MREYYPTGIRLDGRPWWLLWFTDVSGSSAPEPDGVVTEEERVLAFSRRGEAERFGLRQGFAMQPLWHGLETPLLRLDRVASWVQRPRKTIDCPLFLNSWNLLLDVACSVGADDNLVVVRYSRAFEHDPYIKLFFGSNLPSITRGGPRYRPIWSGAEVMALRDVFGDGLTLLRQVLHPSS